MYLPTSAPPYPYVAPTVIEGKETRLSLAAGRLAWQRVKRPGSPELGVGLHEVAAVRLERRLSWGQGALWLVLAFILALGANGVVLVLTTLACTCAAVANLLLRRRFFLGLVLRDGRRFTLFLGDGYPTHPMTFAPSRWVRSFMEGWTWLSSELQRWGIATHS